MQRRSFLSGILAAAAAPAIVHSESLMKLWVPPQDIIVPLRAAASLSAFDEFVLMQLRRIATSMGVQYEELVRGMPNTTLGYSSARIALQQGFHTPLSRPLSARFSNGQIPS